MFHKKNAFTVLSKPVVRNDAAKGKACASCGSRFFPRFLFSLTCDFCRTPQSSLFAVLPLIDLAPISRAA